MRKVAFLLLIPLVFPKIVFSQSITTGDASAKSTVVNEVSGNSNVYTKIEVEANGEKKILETTEPGEHTLEVSSGFNASAESEISIEKDINTDKDKDDSGAEGKDTEVTGFNPVNYIEKIFEGLADFFKNILSLF